MTMATQQNSKLQVLASLLSENVQLILDELGVEYKETSSKFYGCCPVHNGDNEIAWNLYPNVDEGIPIWKCRTHHCHAKYKQTILGLIHGVLQAQNPSRTVGFNEAVKWASNLIDVDLGTLKVDAAKLEKKRFVTSMNYFNKQQIDTTNLITRDKIRERLVIPCEYYLNRGFTPEILDKYDVGLCTNPQKGEMYNRAIVPIYDDTHTYMLGVAARSIFDQCHRCKVYHSDRSPCVSKPTFKQQSKWIYSDDFQASLHFYNYWFAKRFIKETGVAILVEGQGDVWKAAQAGINNVLGMFSNDLTDGQMMKLEKSGALSLIVLADNDEGGNIARESIKKKCGRLYRLYFPEYNGKDFGELNTDAITSDIKPFIDSIMRLQ